MSSEGSSRNTHVSAFPSVTLSLALFVFFMALTNVCHCLGYFCAHLLIFSFFYLKRIFMKTGSSWSYLQTHPRLLGYLVLSQYLLNEHTHVISAVILPILQLTTQSPRGIKKCASGPPVSGRVDNPTQVPRTPLPVLLTIIRAAVASSPASASVLWWEVHHRVFEL